MKKHNVESPQESLPCISETRLNTLRPKGTKSDYDGSSDIIGNGHMIFGLQVASKVSGIICNELYRGSALIRKDADLLNGVQLHEWRYYL